MTIEILKKYDDLYFAYAEAQRITDEQGVYDQKGFDMIHTQIRTRYFLRSVQPLIDYKIKLYQTLSPKIIIHCDEITGDTIDVKMEYEYTPEQHQFLDEIDRHIAYEARYWQVTYTEPEILKT